MYSNRSDSLMDITVHLARGTQEICDSEKYRAFLDILSRFHHYSASNCMLILMQKPDATFVAGYRTWQKTFGRTVRKGEKAIRILVPVHRKAKDGSAKNNPPAFRTASVFDISQTEGKPLPLYELKTICGDVELYDVFFAKLCAVSPVPVFLQDTGSHAYGFYDEAGKRIVIADDLPQIHCLKTLIHEIVHATMHAESTLSREQMEVEAESIAYVVMKHYGMDTSEYSFPYVAVWSKGNAQNRIKESLERIRSCADRLICAIDAQN